MKFKQILEQTLKDKPPIFKLNDYEFGINEKTREFFTQLNVPFKENKIYRTINGVEKGSVVSINGKKFTDIAREDLPSDFYILNKIEMQKWLNFPLTLMGDESDNYEKTEQNMAFLISVNDGMKLKTNKLVKKLIKDPYIQEKIKNFKKVISLFKDSNIEIENDGYSFNFI